MNTVGNYVRSFPYPVMEEGNLSFPLGSYEVELVDRTLSESAGAKIISVMHHVKNARLIQSMLQSGKFAYGCAVASPLTGYRKFFQSKHPQHEITWDSGHVLGNVQFSPAIFCKEPVCNHVLSPDCDVSDLWIGKSVNFAIGAKVAISAPYTLSSSVQHMLRFRKNENVSPGQMQAGICEDGDFRFDVDVSQDVFKTILNPQDGEGPLRRAIVINAMSACLALLAKDYGNDSGDSPSWKNIPNLVSLSDEIHSAGLPLWDADDFCPEKTATALYPYILQGGSDDSDT